MLSIEKLICQDNKRHTGCRWHGTHLRYSDDKYPLIKESLQRQVMESQIAHRVIHDIRGKILTIKVGSDGELYIREE